MEGYFIQSGSVTGSDHNLVGKPNQDFGFLINRDDIAIGMVSDGCGSEENSQFGSILLSKIVSDQFENLLTEFGVEAITRENLNLIFLDLEKNIESKLKDVSKSLNLLDYRIGKKYLLCTMMGFILTKDFVSVFHYGDGWYRFDGNVVTNNTIKFDKNAPDYFAYKLYSDQFKDNHFGVQTYSLENFKSLVISTDGIETLDSEDINELLSQDLYVKNPKALQRFLQKRNKEHIKIDYDNKDIQRTAPKLKDDTTTILIRKI